MSIIPSRPSPSRGHAERPSSTTPSQPVKPRPSAPAPAHPAPRRSDTDHPDPRGTAAAVGAAAGAAARILDPITRLFGGTPRVELDADARPLRERALDTRHGGFVGLGRDRTWDPDSDDLTTARNAHHSNTHDEMRHALDDDFDWLEGDLRVDDAGTLVMAHDADQEGSGLTLEEWIAIGGAGDRGLKVDVKESEAIPELLDQLEASDIPDGRIMLNVGVGVGESTIREMRERFPDAWLAINPSPGDDNDYGPDDLRTATELADAAGGRVAFPLRWDLVTDEVIDTLRPHGKVSIWTSKSQGTPDDPRAEAERLRERGVDGVIDLGPPSSWTEKVGQFGLDVWESDPVRGTRELGGDVVEGAGDLVEGAGNLIDDAPLIGGLFGN